MKRESNPRTGTETGRYTPARHPNGHPDPRPGQVLAGRFLLTKELGRGGSATVFAARDAALGATVAVKVIRPDLSSPTMMERLRREVRAARATHPNAVTVYDLYTEAGLTFLAMELVEGTSLRDHLEEHGKMSVNEVVGIGRQIANALHHFHSLGLVHRDVKPGNILLTEEGLAKLCDMGLVLPMEGDATLTATSIVMGTPPYMSPEQAMGTGLTTASDVYSLGLTLWQCLTGEIPLLGDTAVATAVMRARSTPPSLRARRTECPAWLDRLIRRMLDPEPRERPTAAAVIKALERGHAPLRPRRRTLVTAVLAAALTATCGAAWYSLQRSPTVRTEVLEREVRGVDARGRVTWHYDLPAVISQHAETDLDGDGVPETAVVTQPGVDMPSRSSHDAPAEILVVDRAGRVRVRVNVADVISLWSGDYPKTVTTLLRAVDLDGDGATELVVAAHQTHFYPTALLIYWPRANDWQQVLYHSGHIVDFRVLPSQRAPRIRFLAIANRLAMVPVIGEIEVTPVNQSSTPLRTFVLASPEEGFGGTANLRWNFYTLLDATQLSQQAVKSSSLSVTPEGSTRFYYSGVKGTVDRWGNPTPGPNAGRDLREERARFLRSLIQLRWFGEEANLQGPAAVRSVESEVKDAAAPLLAERPYRALLALAVSRALARAGDLRGAEERLEAEIADAPWDDLVYRLASLEALGGDLDGATRRLETAVSTPRSSRAVYDMPILLADLSVAAKSGDELRRVLPLLVPSRQAQSREGCTAALWARAHLWWDEIDETDTRVRSWPYVPGGDAVACLARWRIGRTAADDVDRMQDSLERNPDAGYEIRIALAAAQLGRGRAEDALATADAVSHSLEPMARDDFSMRQLYDLARAMWLKALAATGERERAAREAASLLPDLRPGLLPAHLAHEVLASAPKGARPSE